jgi:adenylyl cyclase-associated protein
LRGSGNQPSFFREPLHVEWAKAWIDTLQQLHVFVKKNHTTGVSWNPRGNDVSGVPHSVSAARNLGAGPPPPGPPPPIDPQFFKCNFPPQDQQSDVRAALFQELNKGDKVTSGLKKVSADMQTHKNAALRAGALVPKSGPGSPLGRGGAGAAKTGPNGPVKLELNDKKWEVHNHQGNQNIVIDQAEMNHSIYIYRCADSVVTIKGKVRSITVDSCFKTAVVCESLVSAAEIINSQRTQRENILSTVFEFLLFVFARQIVFCKTFLEFFEL